MGTVVVSIGIGDPQGRRFEDVEAIVDTGSTFTAIPRTTLQRLGVPVATHSTVRTGRRKQRAGGHRKNHGQT